ncbi:MAG: flagellar motor switch protein FliN [Bryobacteraceae bacterium]
MSDSHLDQTLSDEAVHQFFEAWTGHFVAALTSLLGEQVELLDDGKPPLTSPNCWFHQTFTPLGGSVSLGLDREAVLCVGVPVRPSTVEAEGPGHATQSLVKMLGQAAAGMASQLSAQYKCEVRAAAVTQSDQLPASVRHISQFRLVMGARSYPVSMAVALPTSGACSMPTHALAASVAVDSLAVNTRNLDLLLDVELPISVSFGRAQLPLKDVIKLTTGSIVELNRSVSEPVDIIVNNCTIARGEVVVVEGNFGVRIKQIVSKQERLRSVM